MIMPKEYPCEKCKIKKDFRKWGFDWIDNEDCPYECPHVKEMVGE